VKSEAVVSLLLENLKCSGGDNSSNVFVAGDSVPSEDSWMKYPLKKRPIFRLDPPGSLTVKVRTFTF
jgi:hypothetical protein